MTAEEAIKEIKAQSRVCVNGFQVISINADDIEEYGDKELKERFAKMTVKQKAKLLSLLMDEIYNTMEEGEDYGFGNMFRDTMTFIDEENRRDELYEACK